MKTQWPAMVYNSMLHEHVRDNPNATIRPVSLNFMWKAAGTVYILNSVSHRDTQPHVWQTSCTAVSKLWLMFLHVAGRQGIRLCKDNTSPHLALILSHCHFEGNTIATEPLMCFPGNFVCYYTSALKFPFLQKRIIELNWENIKISYNTEHQIY